MNIDEYLMGDHFKHISCEKEYVIDTFKFPVANESVMLDAKDDNRNEYKVDINRKRAILTRCTYQERLFTSIILLRLDIDTKPHKNPHNGEVISGNHIHVYTDEFGDALAFELDNPILNKINPDFDISRFNIDIKNRNRLYGYFEAFSDFCNIKNIPKYQLILD